jgi:hypothetical protein
MYFHYDSFSVPDQSDLLPRRRGLFQVSQEPPDTVLSATARNISGTLHRNLSLGNSLTHGFDMCATNAASDPVTPMIVDHFGTWPESPFLPIVRIRFLACASIVSYTSHIRFLMTHEGSMLASLSRVLADGAPWSAVLLGTLRLLLRLNDEAIAKVLVFGTSGLYAMFAMATGVGRYTRLTGRWDFSLGQLNLGSWR